MKRLMELENKIADLEEEMENPKALSIHRASQVTVWRKQFDAYMHFPVFSFFKNCVTLL